MGEAGGGRGGKRCVGRRGRKGPHTAGLPAERVALPRRDGLARESRRPGQAHAVHPRCARARVGPARLQTLSFFLFSAVLVSSFTV